jgi:hypothetical protein
MFPGMNLRMPARAAENPLRRAFSALSPGSFVAGRITSIWPTRSVQAERSIVSGNVVGRYESEDFIGGAIDALGRV